MTDRPDPRAALLDAMKPLLLTVARLHVHGRTRDGYSRDEELLAAQIAAVEALAGVPAYDGPETSAGPIPINKDICAYFDAYGKKCLWSESCKPDRCIDCPDRAAAAPGDEAREPPGTIEGFTLNDPRNKPSPAALLDALLLLAVKTAEVVRNKCKFEPTREYLRTAIAAVEALAGAPAYDGPETSAGPVSSPAPPDDEGWLCPKCGEQMNRPVSPEDCGNMLCPGAAPPDDKAEVWEWADRLTCNILFARAALAFHQEKVAGLREENARLRDAAVADAKWVSNKSRYIDELTAERDAANARLAALERPAGEPSEEDLAAMSKALHVAWMGANSLSVSQPVLARAAYRIAAQRSQPTAAGVPAELLDRLPEPHTDTPGWTSDQRVAVGDLISRLRSQPSTLSPLAAPRMSELARTISEQDNKRRALDALVKRAGEIGDDLPHANDIAYCAQPAGWRFSDVERDALDAAATVCRDLAAIGGKS